MSGSDKVQAATSGRRRRKQVVIVGGGIAGLWAADYLQQRGHEVLVLVADDRVGGRIRTFWHEGQHAEMGAMRIPGDHKLLRRVARELQVPLRPFVQFNDRNFLRLRGEQHRVEDWPYLQRKYVRAEDWTQRRPRDQYHEMIMSLASQLSDAEVRAGFDADLGGSDRLAALSRKSLREALLSAGWSRETVDVALDVTAMRAYDTYDAREQVLEHGSLLSAEKYEPVDGMEALTDALARRIGTDRIRLHSEVSAVEVMPGGRAVMVRWSSPTGPQAATFDYAIMAVPAKAAAQIEFHPPLPDNQSDALNRVHYAPAAKSLIVCDQRLWEQDLGIFGGISLMDGVQVVFPSDNARRVNLDSPRGGLMADLGPGAGPLSVHYRARSVEVSRGPGIVVLYFWDTLARGHNDLPQPERREATGHIDLSRPEGRDKNALRIFTGLLGPEAAKTVSDIQHVPYGQAFRQDRPGEHELFQGPLEQPHPLARPLVWFAGEHLRGPHGWIEPALRSGGDAAQAVHEAP